jgi:2-dehydropantoate 2-reductase
LLHDGSITVVPDVQASSSLGDAFSDHGEYDLACLTVKSYDTETALKEMTEATRQPPPMLTMQNGVGNEELLADRLGAERVMAGTITSPAEIVEPGTVVVARPGSVGLAPVHARGSLRGADVALRQAGFHVRVYDDYRSLKWSKLLMNMIGNAVSAILDWPPERVFAHRQLCALEMQAFREGLSVIEALEVRLARVGSYPVPVIAPLLSRLPVPLVQPLLEKLVGEARGGKMPSLHTDLSRGRRDSEVDVLNGAIRRTGVALGVPVAVNRALHLVLTGIVHGHVAWDDFRGRPKALLQEAGLAA